MRTSSRRCGSEAPLHTGHGHKDGITRATWSADGSRLASASLDSTVKIWNSSNVTSALDTGDDHNSSVGTVAWSPDGRLLASGSYCPESSVKVWDSANLTAALDTGDDHAHSPLLSAWSSDPANVCRTGSPRLDSVAEVAWSPDGSRLASASMDNTIKIWNSSNLSRALATGYGHTAGVVCVAWSPDGSLLASGSFDGTIRIWDSTNLTAPLDVGDDHSYTLLVATGILLPTIMSVAWSPDGRRLASASRDYTIKIWNSSNLATALATGDDHTNNVNVAAWSPDGSRLASGSWDHTIKLWDTSDYSPDLTTALATYDYSKKLWWVAWSPDGTRLASVSEGTAVEIWDSNCTYHSPLPPARLSEGAVAAAASLGAVLLLLVFGVLAWRQRVSALVATMRVELLGLPELARQQAELSREQKEALERQLGEQGGEVLSAGMLRACIDMTQLLLGEQLGDGSFGTVLRGVYQQTPCAVKQLKRHRLTEEGLAAFKREVEMQLDLRHPNIIQLIGWCCDLDEGMATQRMPIRSHVCMVMELGADGTLGALLGDPLSELDWGKERLPIGLGVARAMAYLHSVRIIHRDLKPENVLLGDAMIPKVADFGVSREGDASLTMTACGTPLFASPELLTHSRYDQTVDAWSFGCVVACLHHWRPTPYPGEPAASLVSRIVAGDIKPGQTIPDGAPLKALVQKCCELNPAARPSFIALCDELCEPLEDEVAQKTPRRRGPLAARAHSFGSGSSRRGSSSTESCIPTRSGDPPC